MPNLQTGARALPWMAWCVGVAGRATVAGCRHWVQVGQGLGSPCRRVAGGLPEGWRRGGGSSGVAGGVVYMGCREGSQAYGGARRVHPVWHGLWLCWRFLPAAWRWPLEGPGGAGLGRQQ